MICQPGMKLGCDLGNNKYWNCYPFDSNTDSRHETSSTTKPNGVVCTQDAKQCPDGSFVGREGKDCKFKECPTLNKQPIIPDNFPGAYVVYSESWNLNNNDKEGKLILFFKASWCPTCKALDKDIKENSLKIPFGFWILDVDYDKYNDLKKKYGVTYQHTLVQINGKGEIIKKWSGSSTLNDLIQEIE